MLNKILNTSLFTILCCIPLLILLPELFGNPNTIQKYFYISSSQVLTIVVLLVVILRLRNCFKIHPLFHHFLTFLFPVTLLIAVYLSVIGFILPPNFLYSMLHLNYDKLFFASLYSLILILLNQPNDFYKKNYRTLIFLSGPVLFYILAIIALWPFDRLATLVKEDNLIEYSQFFVLLVGGIISILLSQYLWVSKKKIFAVIFFFLALGLFATAGDEISWGQRILGIETPEKFKELNAQDETGFHNFTFVDGLVPFIYMLIGLYGTISHLFQNKLSKKFSPETLKFFIPPQHLIFFFLIPFLYNSYTSFWNHKIGIWSEVAELYLYLGVFLFIIELHYQLNAKR